MREYGVALIVTLGACGEEAAPDPPVRLELVGETPVFAGDFDRIIGFDGQQRFVVSDGTQLLRMVDGQLEPVPGGEGFGTGAVGQDHFGNTIITSHTTGDLARLVDTPELVTPQPPSTFLPAGLPSLAFWVSTPGGASFGAILDDGADQWRTSSLDVTRSLRAGDGNRYALARGFLMGVAASNELSEQLACAEILDAQCTGQFIGSDRTPDAETHLALLGPRPGVQFFNTTTLVVRSVQLPDGLGIRRGHTGLRGTLVQATDEVRGQDSLWFLPPDGDEFIRFLTLPDPAAAEGMTLLSDGVGKLYVENAGELHVLVEE